MRPLFVNQEDTRPQVGINEQHELRRMSLAQMREQRKLNRLITASLTAPCFQFVKHGLQGWPNHMRRPNE